jgi:hypothetical protein
MIRQIAQLSIWEARPLVVLDSPLLFESGSALLCKKVCGLSRVYLNTDTNTDNNNNNNNNNTDHTGQKTKLLTSNDNPRLWSYTATVRCRYRGSWTETVPAGPRHRQL